MLLKISTYLVICIVGDCCKILRKYITSMCSRHRTSHVDFIKCEIFDVAAVYFFIPEVHRSSNPIANTSAASAVTSNTIFQVFH